MNQTEFLASIDAVYDLAEPRRAAQLRQILKSAETAFAGREAAVVHLLRGYAAYHFPESIPDGVDVISELSAALDIQPHDKLARYYLACQYFDIREFQKAAECFAYLDGLSRDTRGQNLRWLKNRELRLCCDLELGRFSNVVADLANLTENISATLPENLAAPIELVRAFESTSKMLRGVLGSAAFEQCLLYLQKIVRQSETADAFQSRLDRLWKS